MNNYVKERTFVFEPPTDRMIDYSKGQCNHVVLTKWNQYNRNTEETNDE